MTGNRRTAGRNRPALSLRRQLAMYAVMLVITVVLIDAAAYYLLVEPKYLRYSGILYDPSMVTQDYAYYLANRDPDLGWGPPAPSPREMFDDPRGEHAAADGTRADPAFSAAVQPCISLFGDSFTWAAEVPDGEAWGSLLASRLRCRVANYGIGGYGSDQAYLRYLSLPRRGGVVFLNHLSENILRNVNQFHNLLYPAPWFGLKPRFIVEKGVMRRIPIPQIPPSDVSRFLAEPARYLEHEYFLPGGPAGIEAIRLPYSVTVIKAALWNYRIRAGLSGTPSHMDFYRPDHASKGLEATFAIIHSFVHEAASRDQVPVVTIMPTCGDFQYFNKAGAFPYDSLARRIVAERLRYIDFGREIAKRAQISVPERLYVQCYGRHFTAVGNRLLADIAFDYLQADAELADHLNHT